MPFDPNRLQQAKQGKFDPSRLAKAKFDPSRLAEKKATSDQPSIMDRLRTPERMSREGLTKIAEMTPNPEPTGNLARDVVAGTPRIVAETFAETAPSFVSPEAIGMGVAGKLAGPAYRAAKPILQPLAKFAGKTGSNLAKVVTGVQPEDTAKLFNKPLTLFAKTKDKASKFYSDAAKRAGATLKPVTPEEAFEGARRTAMKVLAEASAGRANPARALEGRQAIDEVINAGRKSERVLNKLNELRAKLDRIVKSNPGLAKADQVFADSRVAGKFRRLFPVNKTGTPSVLRATGGAFVAGATGNPLLPIVQSPLTLGAVTAGAGGLAKGVKLAGKALTKAPARATIGIGAAINKTLTEDEAKEYLRRAGGDPNLARRLARQELREIPD